MKNLSFVLLILFATFQSSFGGNIFMWMTTGSKSHFNLWKPLALELHKRNHSLTIVTPYPCPPLQTLSNVKFIISGSAYLIEEMNSTDIFDGANIYDIKKIKDDRSTLQDVLFKNPDIQELIRTKPKFDVSIIDGPFSSDLGLYLAKESFDSHVIILLALLRYPLIDRAMGNSVNPSFIPFDVAGFSQKMTFVERLQNAFLTYFMQAVFDYYLDPAMGEKIKELLHLEEAPDMTRMSSDISFTFLNAHPSLESISPINPNTAMIGGIQLGPAEPLTGELKQWLDEAKDGVILVSFGTVLKGSQLSEAKRKILIDTFSKLKQRIIWKWETEEMENKPANVMLKKWVPQTDVLAHPNVKLFITHGGLLSTEESLYHNVPMLVMPGFADQFANAARTERLGYGKELRWIDLDDTSLLLKDYVLLLQDMSKNMVQALLKDDIAQTKANFYGDLFRDNLVSGLDTAVFYTEYIIRHKGAPHLRSPVKDLYWFQYLLLDVAAFLIVVVSLALFFVYKLGGLVIFRIRCFFRYSTTKFKQN